MSQLPAPSPIINPDTEAFWEATTEDKLLIGRCNSCQHSYYYPRPQCPECFGNDTKLVEASGVGTIYACTLVRQAGGLFADATPYILAYVELEENPRIMTNIVGVSYSDIAIGDKVEVVFDSVNSSAAIPRFTPTS
jgi:uncharacterized OB-fold protein